MPRYNCIPTPRSRKFLTVYLYSYLFSSSRGTKTRFFIAIGWLLHLQDKLADATDKRHDSQCDENRRWSVLYDGNALWLGPAIAQIQTWTGLAIESGIVKFTSTGSRRTQQSINVENLDRLWPAPAIDQSGRRYFDWSARYIFF
jgi:hypothetical protein